MIVNIGIGFSFLIILFIILGVFSFKKKIDKIENNIFKKIIITTIFGLLIDVTIYILVLSNDSNLFIIELLTRFMYIYYLVWMYYFVCYNSVIFFEVKSREDAAFKKRTNYLKLFYLFSVLATLFLPIVIDLNSKYFYPGGICTYAQYFLFSFGMMLIFVFSLNNLKLFKHKEVLPLITVFVLGIASTIIQILFHDLMLIVPSQAIGVILMYFTIENPDIRLIEQLNVAKDAAEKANSAKSDFLSSMSHEIRTPLNAIVGFSNGLLESNDLPETAKGDVKNIIMASDNLLELVNGILDISKIEAGKLEIIDVNYSFHKIFDELVLLTKARLGEKPLDFRYAYDSSVPEYLYGDGTRVKQIVLNLLTNAVKYTKTGYVDFKVNSVIRGDVVRLIICVEDSGIGIKKESIEKLFTKFERLDVEKNSTIEGTGLGLAITKKLTEMMGGTIVVQSVYGQGSKFTVSIDQKIVTGEELEKLKRENDNSVNAEEVVDGHGKRILVVDDNNLNIKVAERLLGKFNVVIDSCSSGFDCVNKITSGEKYDLLLLDDMMPKMSGTETLHKLKEVNGFNTPVIVLTANAITGMREKYLSEGFDDYLSKPIEKDELKRVIKQYLG